MKNPLHNHPLRRLLALAAAVLALAVVMPGLASAATGGDNNKGDVWVDTVGEPPGPGHEMDPHLPCANINLWGDKMADAGGSYKIYGWQPSGAGAQAYASNWAYNGAQGGSQVMDVIDVQTLVANAVANGDAPVNKQGFHFKIALSQDPHKFKTFWVNCPLPTPQGGGSPDSPPPAAVDRPGADGPQQVVLGVRETGGKKAVQRKHRKHHKRAHHRRKHHKVAARRILPAFTG